MGNRRPHTFVRMIVLLRIFLLIIALFILPLGAHALWWTLREDVAPSWRAADWSSAKLLPPPSETQQAIVAVYAARVGRWRGIFAHHTWIVVKEAGARQYTRYDKVGWGSPVRTNGWAPDGRWFGNAPHPVAVIEGEAAERLIPQIRKAVTAYPYASYGAYNAWPGPNSNTFVAHVLRAVPELDAALPPTALGKDWRPLQDLVGLTPSRTGIQISLAGYAGLALGWVEGIEIDFMGLVAGIDFRRPALKIPAWGRIGMDPITW